MLKRNLESGTKIILVDDLNPEDSAMLQALYSRSAESVETHLRKLLTDAFGTAQASDKAGEFLKRYYVNFGHKSIGDCGSTTLFFENVSLLAAKAIQDNPLYSGQETSTRYIDMSKQRIIDPFGTPASAKILERWMRFYTENQDRTAAEVRRRHPRREGEDEKVYEGAVKARTFDIMRGFLPAGICTQLSWHSNLRQINDNLRRLALHPTDEVVDLAFAANELLQERYPSSGWLKDSEPFSTWESEVYSEHAYEAGVPGFVFESTLHKIDLMRYEHIFSKRPRGQRLPHWMGDFGQLTWRFNLDFGSFRDIQRQRNGVCRMPLLTTYNGFEEWYLEQLDEETRRKAEHLINEQCDAIDALNNGGCACSDVDKQYYIALGFRVPCTMTYALPAAVYVMELRSGKTIHPTLRREVHRMVKQFQDKYPMVKLHVDTDPDDWTVRRGTQTITERRSQ